jgi:hypothetical protein
MELPKPFGTQIAPPQYALDTGLELQHFMFPCLVLVLLWSNPSLLFSYYPILEWNCLFCAIVSSKYIIFFFDFTGYHSFEFVLNLVELRCWTILEVLRFRVDKDLLNTFCVMRWSWAFGDHGLNRKCLPQAHVLNTWPQLFGYFGRLWKFGEIGAYLKGVGSWDHEF